MANYVTMVRHHREPNKTVTWELYPNIKSVLIKRRRDSVLSFLKYLLKRLMSALLWWSVAGGDAGHQCHQYHLDQWFSNFLHQVPPQKIFGFPSTTIMTNIKMQYKWLPTAPGVCSRGVCVCVCVCVHCCVCAHFGWVKCRAQIPSMSRHFHFQ